LKCAFILPAGSWEDTQEQVKNGKGDGLFLIGWDVKRAEHFLPTDEIINTEYGFFVKADDPLHFTGAEAMDGYMVGAYGPSNTSRTLQKIAQVLRDTNFKLTIDEQQTADPLFSKRETSDKKYAVFSNKEVGNSIVRRLGLKNVRYAGREKCLSYYVGIAKRRDGPDIIARFNQAFHHIEEAGLKRVILAPYGISIGDSECGKSNGEQPPRLPEPPRHVPADPPTDDCVARKVGNDETVECSKSCLTWQKAGSDRPLTWHEASSTYLTELNDKRVGGASDWRLPTTEELKTLLTKEVTRENRMFLTAGFSPKQAECWAADRRKDAAHDDADYVDFYNGEPGAKAPTDTNYVRAVHGTYCGPH